MRTEGAEHLAMAGDVGGEGGHAGAHYCGVDFYGAVGGKLVHGFWLLWDEGR